MDLDLVKELEEDEKIRIELEESRAEARVIAIERRKRDQQEEEKLFEVDLERKKKKPKKGNIQWNMPEGDEDKVNFFLLLLFFLSSLFVQNQRDEEVSRAYPSVCVTSTRVPHSFISHIPYSLATPLYSTSTHHTTLFF